MLTLLHLRSSSKDLIRSHAGLREKRGCAKVGGGVVGGLVGGLAGKCMDGLPRPQQNKDN